LLTSVRADARDREPCLARNGELHRSAHLPVPPSPPSRTHNRAQAYVAVRSRQDSLIAVCDVGAFPGVTGRLVQISLVDEVRCLRT
jgi:hypothetical protein